MRSLYMLLNTETGESSGILKYLELMGKTEVQKLPWKIVVLKLGHVKSAGRPTCEVPV